MASSSPDLVDIPPRPRQLAAKSQRKSVAVQQPKQDKYIVISSDEDSESPAPGARPSQPASSRLCRGGARKSAASATGARSASRSSVSNAVKPRASELAKAHQASPADSAPSRSRGGTEPVAAATSRPMSSKAMSKVLDAAWQAEHEKIMEEVVKGVEELATLDEIALAPPSLSSNAPKPSRRSAFRPSNMPPATSTPPSFSAERRRLVALSSAPCTNTILDLSHADGALLPRADYREFRAHGAPYPMEGHDLPPLVSYPSIKSFEDRSVEKEEREEELVESVLRRLLTMQGQTEVEDAEERDLAEDKLEGMETVMVGEGRKWVMEDLRYAFDGDSLYPSEQLRTIRDFGALRTLIDSLALKPKLRSSLVAGDFDGDFDTFVAEYDAEIGDELAKAFDLFESKTGRRPWDVEREHRVLSHGSVMPEHPEPPICPMCGMVNCQIHFPDTGAGNVPTSTSYAALAKAAAERQKQSSGSHKGSCRSSCHYQDAPSSGTPRTEEETKLCAGLVGRYPHWTACDLAATIGKACAEIHAYFQETDHVPIEAPLLRGNVEVDLSQLGRKSRGTRRLAPDTFPIAKSAGYDPCNCTGEACPIDAETSNCQCWARETWCDRFCSCASNCPRRFQGCRCYSVKRECTPEDCPCALAYRECDPHVCTCPDMHASADPCYNSRIRTRDFRKTIVVESTDHHAGFGLAMLEPALKGDLLGLYGGEKFEVNEPYGQMASTLAETVSVSYFFTVDTGTSIDSAVYRNTSAYINDMGNYNCECRYVYIDGTHQVAIYATKDLRAGEELSLNYGSDYPKPWEGKRGTKKKHA